MSKIITAVMLALAMALASPAYAVATWEHFGADPAYQSREAAIADAPRVLRQKGYPESAISLLTEAMKKPGVEAHVTNGMKLDFMRSGQSDWSNVVVKFEKPPRQDSMEYSAPSEEWTVEVNGTKWTVGIPKVCNNTYGKRSSASVSSVPPALPLPQKAPLFVTNTCPNGYSIILNVRSLAAMPVGLREEVMRLVRAADKRLSQNGTKLDAYRPDDVSRTLHKRLLAEVEFTAIVTVDVQIRYLDVQTGKLVRDLGTVRLIDGAGIYQFPDDPRNYVVEIIWPAQAVSPTISGGTHRMLIFPSEWKICAPYAHSIFQ